MSATLPFGGADAAKFHVQTANVATETVIYRFHHGQVPTSGLLEVSGKLYGTARRGAYDEGSVFSLDAATGREEVVTSLDGDGTEPSGDLIDAGSTLYGTMAWGGTGEGCEHGCGTVFSVDLTTGEPKLVYSFGGNRDGAGPVGSLIDLHGTLYGVTSEGGSGGGTVFSIDRRTGHERVLHAFRRREGSNPYAGLLYVKGMLYGTTAFAGAPECQKGGLGCGTVFQFDPYTGQEKTLHSFAGGTDGASPRGKLIEVDGALYGTTYWGGAGAYCPYEQGCGTVFSIKPHSGEVKIIHAFDGNQLEGDSPEGGLINVNGTLYGVTGSGPGTACRGWGCGTVFSVEVGTGDEKVGYFFRGGTDGDHPIEGLTDVRGTLYGTTSLGGRTGKVCPQGCGTVYSIIP